MSPVLRPPLSSRVRRRFTERGSKNARLPWDGRTGSAGNVTPPPNNYSGRRNEENDRTLCSQATKKSGPGRGVEERGPRGDGPLPSSPRTYYRALQGVA